MQEKLLEVVSELLITFEQGCKQVYEHLTLTLTLTLTLYH